MAGAWVGKGRLPRVLGVAGVTLAAGVARAVTSICRVNRYARRISVDGFSTSIGANASEADEALSRKDFCKCLGIAIKEISELRFWLRFVTRRAWIAPTRVTDLQAEAQQIKLILGSIISRTKERDSVS